MTKMMTTTLALVAMLFCTCDGLELKQEAAAVAGQIGADDCMMAAQTDVCEDDNDDDYDEASIEPVEAEEFGAETGGRRWWPKNKCHECPYPCHCKTCCNRKRHDYCCPPVVNDCPGITQPTGPCMDAVCERPLRYNNNGHVHTNWGHTMHITGDPKCSCKLCPFPKKKKCKCICTHAAPPKNIKDIDNNDGDNEGDDNNEGDGNDSSDDDFETGE